MLFPPSDHCNGKTFFQPGQPPVRGTWDVLRWKLTSRVVPWPSRVEVQPTRPPGRPERGLTATWINHATFLLQTPGGCLLTDPVFSERVSPFSWVGPRRVHEPGVRFEDLPPIDAILLTHDHYDHCDLPTLRRLAQGHRPLVIAPLGYRHLLAETGLERVVELDWWQSHSLSAGLEIVLTPALHWTRRRIGRANHRLWGGYGIRSGSTVAYFAGDTGYSADLFREIRSRVGSPKLALLPIGAYAPRWFMHPMHIDPAEAIQAHRDLGARVSVGMHWGTWQLTDEGRDDPPRELAAAREAAGLTPEEFRVIAPGESVHVGG